MPASHHPNIFNTAAVPAAVPPIEVLESREDRERRIWSESGCDWAYFVLQFLRGHRRLDIQPKEIIQTQLYQHSDEIEKRALRMVCETEPEMRPTPEDERQLRERDAFLMKFADKKILGHADLAQQLISIPAHVAERALFDCTYFPTKVYESVKLFSWIWER